jgi:hypothetical protein
MKQTLKILLIGLVLCILSEGILIFIHLYLIGHLGEWTYPVVNKYIIIEWTKSDSNLTRWLPLIVAIFYIISGKRKIEEFIKRVFLTLLSFIGFFVLGILFALIFWTSEGGGSPLLPEYIKYQPFAHYWTIFIAIGIILPIIPIFKNRKEDIGVDDTIDQ